MITERDVEHIGMLADIAILHDELEEFTASFNKILEYFDILDQVISTGENEESIFNIFRETRLLPPSLRKTPSRTRRIPKRGFSGLHG